MLEHEAGADMRLVRKINKGMKIHAGGEHMGCSKVGENQENQVICLQCQDEVVRVCPGSPRSPRRAIATRLSSGSAGNCILCCIRNYREGSSYDVSALVWSILYPQFLSQITLISVLSVGWNEGVMLQCALNDCLLQLKTWTYNVKERDINELVCEFMAKLVLS